MVNIWKVTPGENAFLWEECIVNQCIALGWENEDGYKKYKSLEELKKTYDKNNANSIWYFYKEMDIGDVIIANKGTDVVLGIGIVDSDYIDPKDKRNPRLEYKNVRKVNWVITEEIENLSNKFDLKTVTPQNSVNAIERLKEIENLYAKINPAYKELLDGYFRLHEDEIMQTTDNNEQIMIISVYDFIKNKGFTFPRHQIINYYLSLKTKPFVILTGISGTGKTKITELFAKAVCENFEKQYLLLPVRPDWNDDKYLLGYYNPLTKKYQSTPFLDFIMQAEQDRGNPYFVCLDEMNLARVEYYFSTFLSAMESNKKIKLHSETDIKTESGKVISNEIEIPPNLFFTGTVNMDETTYRFSPKVLDRANTIEFTEIELLKPRENENSSSDKPDLIGLFNRYFLNDEVRNNGITSNIYRDWEDKNWNYLLGFLDSINKESLEKNNLHFGYRIRDEILRYIYFAEKLGSSDFTTDTALDFQIKQKILPRIKGPESIRPALESLRDKISDKYPLSSAKINHMLEALQNGYTDFYQ